MTSPASAASHILELSGEILDDLELDRIPLSKLIMKANRLARLAGSDEIKAWLEYETQGYNISEPISLKYMSLTGRWTDRENKKGWFGPLPQQESLIRSSKLRIESTKLGAMSGENMVFVVDRINNSHSQLSRMIVDIEGILSRVTGLIHKFASGVYYERQFADLSVSIFDRYKDEIDAKIAEKSGSVLTKLPSVVERLRENDPEAISQALTTCRRII
jgi:hypothetical protein